MNAEIQRLLEAGVQDQAIRGVLSRLYSAFGPDLLIHQAGPKEACEAWKWVVPGASRSTLRSQSGWLADMIAHEAGNDLANKIRALIEKQGGGARIAFRDTVRLETTSRAVKATIFFRLEHVDIHYAKGVS